MADHLPDQHLQLGCSAMMSVRATCSAASPVAVAGPDRPADRLTTSLRSAGAAQASDGAEHDQSQILRPFSRGSHAAVIDDRTHYLSGSSYLRWALRFGWDSAPMSSMRSRSLSRLRKSRATRRWSSMNPLIASMLLLAWRVSVAPSSSPSPPSDDHRRRPQHVQPGQAHPQVAVRAVHTRARGGAPSPGVSTPPHFR